MGTIEKGVRISALPTNYLDHSHLCRPNVIRTIKNDIEALRAKGITARFSTTDEFEELNRFSDLLGHELSRAAESFRKRYNLSQTEALEVAREHPSARQMAWLINLEYAILSRYYLSGEKLFLLDHGLANRLLHTDMSAPCELVRLPFPTIAIVTSSRDVLEAIHAENRNAETKKGSVTAFISELNDEHGRRLHFLIFHTNREQNLMTISRSISLTDGKSIEEALITRHPKNDENEELFGISSSDDVFINSLYPAIRVFLNSVLYMSSEKALATQEHRNTTQFARDTMNYSNRLHVTLGTGILPISPPGYFKTTKSGSAIKLANADQKGKRVLVMGHFRNQAHGPKRSYRKIIWIEPFWRGDDIADISNKPHRLH